MPCCGSATIELDVTSVSDVRVHHIAASVVADRFRRSLEHCPKNATEYVTASYAESFKKNSKRFSNAAEKSGKGGSNASEPTFAPILKALKRQVENSNLSNSSKRDKGILESIDMINKHFSASEMESAKGDINLTELWRDIGYACSGSLLSAFKNTPRLEGENPLKVDFAVFPASKRAGEGLNTVGELQVKEWRALQRRPGPIPVGKHVVFAAPIHPGLLWTYDKVYGGGGGAQQQQQTTGSGVTTSNPTAVTVKVQAESKSQDAVYDASGTETSQDAVYDASGQPASWDQVYSAEGNQIQNECDMYVLDVVDVVFLSFFFPLDEHTRTHTHTGTFKLQLMSRTRTRLCRQHPSLLLIPRPMLMMLMTLAANPFTTQTVSWLFPNKS